MLAGAEGLEVARAAPKRPMRMSFGLWMALARARPVDNEDGDEAQRWLGDPQADAPGAAASD